MWSCVIYLFILLFQRLIEKPRCPFSFQMSLSHGVCQMIRLTTRGMFLWFHPKMSDLEHYTKQSLRLTLPYPFRTLLSPCLLSSLSLPRILSSLHNLPFASLSSFVLHFFHCLSLTPSVLCIAVVHLTTSEWKQKRWRERDKTVKSQVKSYFQPRCFPYWAVFSFA